MLINTAYCIVLRNHINSRKKRQRLIYWHNKGPPSNLYPPQCLWIPNWIYSSGNKGHTMLNGLRFMRSCIYKCKPVFINKQRVPAACQATVQLWGVKGDIPCHLWWTNYFVKGKREKRSQETNCFTLNNDCYFYQTDLLQLHVQSHLIAL